jgi:hypothetical protein
MERNMYLKFDDDILDGDLDFLKDLVTLLDSRLDKVQQAIDSSFDPDQMGDFADFEYIAGMGFIACQRYLASTYGPHGISKDIAMETGPRHTGGETIARIINAGANFWKHSDEWDLHSTVGRNRSGLKKNQLETIQVIETVTPWADYTCADLLAALVAPAEPRLKCLLPQLEAWRDALDSAHVG